MNPEYNILKIAGSSFGREFSEETREKMKSSALARSLGGINNPMFGKTHNEDTRKKMSEKKR